jgi:hypothetical protein
MNSPVDGVGSGVILGAFRPGPWLSICVDRIGAKPDWIGRLTFAERPPHFQRNDITIICETVHQESVAGRDDCSARSGSGEDHFLSAANR